MPARTPVTPEGYTTVAPRVVTGAPGVFAGRLCPSQDR